MSFPSYQKYAFQNWSSTEFSFASNLAQGIIMEVQCKLWQLIWHLGSDPAFWSHLARSGPKAKPRAMMPCLTFRQEDIFWFLHKHTEMNLISL